MPCVLHDLFSVTLYPARTLLCEIKKKKRTLTLTFDFPQPQPSKNDPWDKQLVFVPKTQIGYINVMAF